MSKVLVIIPAYNEQENIQNVVGDLTHNYPQYDYIVVNDGSSDDTAKVCMNNNYSFLDLPINLGLAGAVQAGMKYAYDNQYDIALQFDGDGQHKGEYIETMINSLEQNNADIVIGSRFINKKKPTTMRMFGGNLIEFMIKITTGKHIADPTSGMRMFNKHMIETFANNINYGPEPDTLAYLIRCGFSVVEVQVNMDDRMAGDSYLSSVRAIKYMLHMFFSLLIMQFARRKESK